MLHIVYANPVESNKLDQCLKELKSDDALLLMGDAVLAISLPRYKNILESLENLYLNRISVEALGLEQWPGIDVGSDDIVRLIVKHGSPLTWK